LTTLIIYFRSLGDVNHNENCKNRRPESIFSQLRLGPHQAVDIEAGVPPGKDSRRPLRAKELLSDKKSHDLVSEDLGQPRVVEGAEAMEDTRLVHSALGHQNLEVRV
jgi:hypothetical protein